MKKIKESNVLLNVLCLEDDLLDAELMSKTLGNIDFQVIMDVAQSEKEYIDFFKEKNYDIILADNSLPSFDAFAALKLAIALKPEIPFICVSGTIGEEKAVELLKQGACDYVIKDKLGRLGFAVERALKEKEVQKIIRHAEEELAKYDVLFKSINKNIPAYIAYVNTDTLQYEFVNDLFEKSFGIPKDKIIGSHIKDVIGETNYKFALKYINEVKSGKSVSYGTFFNMTSGKRWIEVSYSPVIDINNKVVGIAMVSYDLTERKLIEEALKESENKYRELVENSPDAIVIYQDNKIVFANNESLRMVGARSIEDLLGKSLLEFVHPDSRAFVIERMRKIANKETVLSTAEEKFVRFDGSELDVEVIAIPIRFEQKPAVQLIIRNITERKKAEEELRLQSEIMSNMSEAIYMLKMADGIIVYVNHVFEKMFGYEHDEMLGQHASIVNAPTEKSPQQTAKEIMDDINKHGFWKGEVKNIHKDGTVFICYASVTLFEHSKFGKVIVAIHTDITASKQSELALKESNNKFLSLANNISGYIAYVNADTLQYEFVNDLYEKSFGIAEEKIIGSQIKDVMGEANYQFALKYINEVKSGKSVSYENTFDLTSGKRWIQTNYSPVIDSNGHITSIAVLAFDITESKQDQQAHINNERKLYRINADKDRFISILGHDLKNPFNNILGFSEILNKEIESLRTDEIKEIAGNINKSALITNKLLEDILMWARTQQGKIPFNPKKLSFTKSCKEAIDALIPNAKAKNIIINYTSTDHLIVFADEDMLKTVLRNLVSNAIKFTNNGGKINIFAEQTPSNVTISVSDNGIGIPSENLAKLFNISEVITTKGTAKETGTGLGLLLCKEFVEKNGGTIWVESEEGKGSSFIFTLPISL